MIFSKNYYLTQMPFKIDWKGTIVSVITLVFTGDVEVCLQHFQWIPGLSHWWPFRFSVWWFNNLHFNSCSLKCLKNVSCLIVTTHKRINSFQTCVFYCHHRISYSIQLILSPYWCWFQLSISHWMLLCKNNWIVLPKVWGWTKDYLCGESNFCNI